MVKVRMTTTTTTTMMTMMTALEGFGGGATKQL
jgi:hypothetical protein